MEKYTLPVVIENDEYGYLYWWGPAFKDIRVIHAVGGQYIRKVY